MRADSVRRGLNAVSRDCDIIGIHDAARPLVSVDSIEEVFDAAFEFGSATLAVPVTDTLKICEGDFIIGTQPRENIWAVQTPQVFRKDILFEAVEKIDPQISITDDCSIIERLGGRIKIIRGSRTNIKITYPEDLFIASAILKNKPV